MDKETRHDNSAIDRNFSRIESALYFVASNFRSQPTLAEIAASVNLSEFHFQRLFSHWAGVSPKQFLQFLTVHYARQCLAADMTVLDTAYASGLSAPARLGELFVRLESVTPGEYRQGGEGVRIDFGYHDTLFGECLVSCTSRGVTGLAFCSEGRTDALREMQSRLPNAIYTENPVATEPHCEQIFNSLGNRCENAQLSLCAVGTQFQIKVWEALLNIPPGHRVSYQYLADEIGNPKAVRAVASAVGRNPVAVLIPCHRVIRGDGMLGGYHWGEGRKLALQGWESVIASQVTSGGTDQSVSGYCGK